VLLLCGCAAGLPVGTTGTEAFSRANVIVVAAEGEPADAAARAAAALADDGWFVAQQSGPTLTTDWREFPNLASIRLSLSASPDSAAGSRLAVRGEYRDTVYGGASVRAVDFSGMEGSLAGRIWDHMERSARLVGRPVLYMRR
jgi:hypothetical protein